MPWYAFKSTTPEVSHDCGPHQPMVWDPESLCLGIFAKILDDAAWGSYQQAYNCVFKWVLHSGAQHGAFDKSHPWRENHAQTSSWGPKHKLCVTFCWQLDLYMSSCIIDFIFFPRQVPQQGRCKEVCGDFWFEKNCVQPSCLGKRGKV